MAIFGEKNWDSRGVSCPYLPDQSFHQQYFMAAYLDSEEMDRMLQEGYRRFGSYFFRPQCPLCQACQPLRLLVKDLRPSKSQRRILRKNENTLVTFGPMDPRREVFEIYQNHSQVRFGQKEKSFEQFLDSFYAPGAPSLQVEYTIANQLAGVGFCDVSKRALSSVYYFFHEDFQSYNLGTFSVLKEAEIALSLGKDYYYLGYFVKNNPRMEYKGRFFPREILDWNKKIWQRVDEL